MAWIELHQAIWTHRKTILIASKLGLKPTYAASHIIRFWTWALDNVQDGDLSGLPAEVIAFAADWDGDADTFVKAAIYAGWLDETDSGLFIHDWEDYAGKLMERRLAERERSRKRRTISKQQVNDQQTTAGRPPVDQQTTVGTVPNSTLPNHTLPNQNNNKRSAPGGASECGNAPAEKPENGGAQAERPGKGDSYTPEFLEFWSLYPRKVEKLAAFKAWKARLKSGGSPGDLIAAAKNYASAMLGTEQKFIKHASTFLGSNKPYRDWIRAPDEPLNVPKAWHVLKQYIDEEGIADDQDGSG